MIEFILFAAAESASTEADSMIPQLNFASWLVIGGSVVFLVLCKFLGWIGRDRKPEEMSALPTTAIGHLRPGGSRVEIQGVVATPNQSLISPFFQRPCLSYRLKIFVSSAEYRKSEMQKGRAGEWIFAEKEIAERANHQEIQLADSTGRAWIQFGESNDNTNPFDLT